MIAEGLDVPYSTELSFYLHLSGITRR